MVAQGNYYLVVDARTREVVNGWGKDECNALACAVGSCRLHATAVQVAEELDELEDDMRRARKRIQRRIDSLKRIGENMLAAQGTQGHREASSRAGWHYTAPHPSPARIIEKYGKAICEPKMSEKQHDEKFSFLGDIRLDICKFCGMLIGCGTYPVMALQTFFHEEVNFA